MAKRTKLLACLFLISLVSCQDPPPDPPEPPVPPPVIVPNCTLFKPLEGETCKIANLVYTQPANESLIIEYQGSIEISNCTLNCTDECGEDQFRWDNPKECCQLIINATGNVTILGGSTSTPSYFRFSNIEIYSNATFSLGTQSFLDTTGMGYLYGPGYVSGGQSGACYAAQSGYCEESKSVPINLTYSTYYQMPNQTESNVSEQFGSGAGSNQTIGGGRVILLSRGLSLQGEIRANGMPNVSQPISNPLMVGGSGGYIYLGIKDQVSSSKIIINAIKADGGNGQSSGGSGGRIIIDIFSGNYSSINMTSSSKIAITATGGGNETNSQCTYGGPGTIFFKNESKLYINGPGFANLNYNRFAKTLIQGADPRNLSGDFQNLAQLVMNRSAFATFQISNATEQASYASIQSIQLISGSAILSQTASSQTFHLKANNINLVQTSAIDTHWASKTIINSTILTSDSSCALISGQYLTLNGSIILINGTVTTNAPGSQLTEVAAPSASLVVIMVQVLFSLNQYQDQSKTISLQTDKLFIYSKGDVLIQGQIKPQLLSNTCSFNENVEVLSFVQSNSQLPLTEATLLSNFKSQFGIDQSKDMTMWDLQEELAGNFTYTIIALQNFNVTSLPNFQTKILTSRFGSYAAYTRIEGIIDTSSKGCPGGKGLGKGKSTYNHCSASGGAHGGKGGIAATLSTANGIFKEDQCAHFQSNSYGEFDSFVVMEGSGGGGIRDSSQMDAGSGGGIIWIQSSSLLLNQAQLLSNGGSSTDPEGSGVGAGAGGSIMLAMNHLNGNGSIQAVGGDAVKQGGGGGSGGRIKFYFFSWYEKELYNKMNKTISLDVQLQGGPGGAAFQTGENGTLWSTPCAPGYFGIFCDPCPIGFYKTEYSNVQCRRCASIPEEATDSAEYTDAAQDSPMCPFECNHGYAAFDSNHRCLNNVQLFFDNMGGLSIFIIIIIATIFAISAIIYFLQASKKKADLENNDEKLYKLRLAFEELDFIQRDLHQHICRVYLVGNNEIKSPWILPVLPPAPLRNRIHLDKYKEFARRINQSDQRSKQEKFWNYFLQILYPPLRPLYGKNKRREHYYSFKKSVIAESDKIDFWKNYEDHINIELRFTSSTDYTLAYLDFLDTKRTKDSFDKPPLPMTILASGTGSFAKPFQISRQDPLVRSINYYCEDTQMWDMFLANLNSTLLTLCLQNFGFLVQWRLFKLLGYIEEYSKKLFERKGIQLNLWLLEAKSLNRCGGMDTDGHEVSFIDRLDQEEEYYVLTQDYLWKKRDVMSKLISYWRSETFYNPSKVFKLALVITKADSGSPIGQNSASGHNSNGTTPDHNRGGSGYLKGNFQDQLPHRANTVKNSQKSPNTGNSPSKKVAGNTPGTKNRVSTEPYENSHSPFVNNTTLSQQENNIQLLIGSIRELYIDKSRVKVFKNYQYGRLRSSGDIDRHRRDSSCWMIIKHFLKELRMLPSALIKTIALRNSGVIKNFMIAAILYIILVVIDITFTATFIVFNEMTNQGPKIQMILFFTVYPLASCISPVLGIISMMLCKPFFYRALAYMNALTIFTNLLVYIIVEVITDQSGSISQRLGYVWILLSAKLILAQLLSYQIAYFRNPKYHSYDEKLKALVSEAEELDLQNRPRGVQMEMIAEEDNASLMKRHPFGMTPTGSGGLHQRTESMHDQSHDRNNSYMSNWTDND